MILFKISINKREQNTALNARIVSCISENRIMPSYVLNKKKLTEAAIATIITPSKRDL